MVEILVSPVIEISSSTTPIVPSAANDSNFNFIVLPFNADKSKGNIAVKVAFAGTRVPITFQVTPLSVEAEIVIVFLVALTEDIPAILIFNVLVE